MKPDQVGPYLYAPPKPWTAPFDHNANVGICVDCDGMRRLNKNGTCEKCGSASVVRPGSVKAFQPEVSA